VCAVERSTLSSRQKKTTASYIEAEEEEDAYHLRRTRLQLATSTDCIRVDKNY